ncbi:MAG: thiamine phosphate synthase [Gemmatimonadales bacterium]|jgi:thiamine-phosphate pyrophosphorylase
MAPDELRLVAIVGPPTVPASHVVAASEAAVRGGVTAVQLRLKRAGAAEQLALARALVERLAVPVYVNDRADVALAAAARGVHVGWDDLDPTAIRSVAGDRLIVGLSVGDRAEAAAARGAPVDYWSIGSIFRTSTKPDAGTPIGPSGFRTLAQAAPSATPAIAIGGITSRNAPEVIACGAAGVAVSSAIFGASDVAAAARDLRTAVEGALSR